MRLFLNSFRGTAPRLNQEQLTDSMAVTAKNLDISEALQGWYAPRSVGRSFPDHHVSYFQYEGGYWFSWPKETTAVKAPIPSDPWDHVVFTDEDYPKITRNDVALSGEPYPSAAYRLGIPIPDKPLGVIVSDNQLYTGPTPENPETNGEVYKGSLSDEFDTSYVITFVDKWGREGPTSDPTQTVTILEYEGSMLTEVALSLPTVPSGHPLITSGGKFRIYRLNNASDGSGVYQYVGEQDTFMDEFIDRVPSEDLQEAASSQTWLGPPDDDTSIYPGGPLRHISVVSEAFLCGHNNNTVCFSEPGIPHAWPVDYYQVFSEKVINAVPFGSDVAVLTDENPYILSGVHPSSMARTKMAEPAPAVSKDAVAVLAGAVMYAGERGVYALSGSGVSLVSEGFYNLKQWRDLSPETMKFFVYGDALIIRLDTGRVLVMDATNPQAGILEYSETIREGLTDPSDGKFYYTDPDNNLYEFEGTTERMPVTYESKHFRFMKSTNFIYGRVRAESFPIDITVKARRENGTVQSFTKTVQNDDFFYLPARSNMREWWVEVSGDVEIRSIALGSTLQELAADV